jgi:KDO2-lipid IV(A) lauroyltransferase
VKAIKDFFTYILYSTLWRFVRLIPEKTAYGLFEKFADRAYRKNGKRITRLRENYRKVLPSLDNGELEALVRNGVSSAMRYWCDTFRISDWSQKRVAATVTTENNELFLNSVNSGKGVIIALPHAGNWDHAGLYYCSQGIKVHTVAEHLRPERLFRKFLAHRERMGMKVLDLEEKVTDQLISFLREGKLVALVADRDLSRSGVDVEFFGANARMPAGPALLAIKTEANLITAYVSYTEIGIKIRFSGPFSVRRGESDSDEIQRLTQELADQFASDIKSDPASWHMQQRIFVERVSK